MELILSFAAGVVACGLALPVISWLRGRIARYRQATDAEANQVTTVSQVLHLAVQGSPTAWRCWTATKKSSCLIPPPTRCPWCMIAP